MLYSEIMMSVSIRGCNVEGDTEVTRRDTACQVTFESLWRPIRVNTGRFI